MGNHSRIVYIDSIKGLAILLMVMGHVIPSYFSNPYEILDEGPRSAMFLFRFIYSFHMPLLMFCAGVFAVKNESIGIKQVGYSIWKRIQSLIFPSIFAGGILWLQRGGFGYWFLWILFQFVLVTLMICVICDKIPKYGRHIFCIVLCVISLCIMLFLNRLMPYERLPLIDVEHWRLYPYFCLGVINSQYRLIDNVFSKNIVFTIALIIFGILTYWITIMGNHIPKQSITGCLLPISAILTIVYLFREGLNGSSQIEQWLQYLGAHSLEVYILHLFFLPKLYQIGECVLKLANTDGGRTVFFVQFISSLLLSIIIIYMCYMVMNIINKSSILSLLLLGRKSEKYEI